jgi:3-oxoacyl-[acyl-carrier protein] reductase
MAKNLTGKVALVTGGTRGIGAATALALGEDGADVAISYVASSDKASAVVRELQNKGVRAAAFKVDQADPVAVEGLIQSVVERFGRLDILVNNAGVFIGGSAGDPDADVAGLERQFAINVRGVAAAVRKAALIMGAGGRIISVGSTLGERVPFSGLADYSATKAAIVAYTKGWARDLGQKGIHVNAVQPGPIDTDMNPDDGESAEIVKRRTALKRFGRPEEVAAAIVFLAGPGASYITGTTLTVDGGLNA